MNYITHFISFTKQNLSMFHLRNYRWEEIPKIAERSASHVSYGNATRSQQGNKMSHVTRVASRDILKTSCWHRMCNELSTNEALSGVITLIKGPKQWP